MGRDRRTIPTKVRDAVLHEFSHRCAFRGAANPHLAARDYFAELFVAGLMADAGWNIYFPHRDRGMDFIVAKTRPDGLEHIRPVQVKGKYPTADKGDKAAYGYVGKLNQLHPEMVLAIPFFGSAEPGPALHVAYMPFSRLRKHQRGWRCEPCSYTTGAATPRRDFKKFFDQAGLAAIDQQDWSGISATFPVTGGYASGT